MSSNRNPVVATIPEVPEFHIFRLKSGVCYLLEANSLMWWKVADDNEIEKIKENFKESFRPQFKFGMAQSCGAVCVEACHRCNLACEYCFVKNYYPEGLEGITQFETVKNFLDTYVKNESIQIGFFGGEPLTNMELVVKVYDYCRGKYKNPSFHVTTNGTLLPKKSPALPSNQTIGEWLNEKGFSSIVSIDGPREAHNLYRKYKDGRGSFDDVRKGLEFMRGSSFIKRTTLRGTFTSEIVHSPISLKDRLAFMNQLKYDGLGSHVSLEPVVLSETSCVSAGEDMSMMNKVEFLGQLRDSYYEAAEWYISEIKAGRNPAWHQVGKWIERVFWRVHAATECGAGTGYLSVNWKGDITACHREHSSYIGCLKTGIDEKLRAKWVDNRIYAREGCMECESRYICGGGCREASMGEYGNIRKPVVADCEIKRIWMDIAFQVIDTCPEESIAKLIPNPRDASDRRRRASVGISAPSVDKSKSGKTCDCEKNSGASSDPRTNQPRPIDKKMEAFQNHIRSGISVIFFYDKEKDTDLVKLSEELSEKVPSIKALRIQASFNANLLSMFSASSGDVIVIKNGSVVKNWKRLETIKYPDFLKFVHELQDSSSVLEIG